MSAGNSFQDRYGPWAVVTGATSGIGLSFARELARRGVNLCVAGQSKTETESLARELAEKRQIKAKAIAGDLATPEGIKVLLAECAGVDIGLAVLNAGFGSSGQFIEQDLRNELRLVDVNVRAVTIQAHEFGRRLAERRRGGLIFLSSIVAWQGVPRAANYAASKAYVQSLAEGLRVELKPAGVDVLAVAPERVKTNFAATAGMRYVGVGPDVVARSALRALGRKTTESGHFMSWFLSGALSTLPRPIRVRIMTGVMAGMTKAAG